MTQPRDSMDRVRGVVAQYLEGELPYEAALESLKPIIHDLAEEQAKLLEESTHRAGKTIQIRTLPPQEYQNPAAWPAAVMSPVFLAPGRSPSDEQKARALFSEAIRRFSGDHAA